MRSMIETVLKNWELDAPETGEQFNAGSPRLIFRIRTRSRDYLLKGLPHSIPEETVKSNVQAHLFLGNRNGLAPKLYPTAAGDFYVSEQGYRFYLMEFIDGRMMEETAEDAYKIGQAAKKCMPWKDMISLPPNFRAKNASITGFGSTALQKLSMPFLTRSPILKRSTNVLSTRISVPTI